MRASWRPEAAGSPPPPLPPDDEDEDETPANPSKASRLISKYGWRVYALPVLMVLTVLVVVDNGMGSGAQPEEKTTGTSEEAPAAIATENPAAPVAVNIPTAELPEGGEYTQAGAGSWHVVDGGGEQAGTVGEVLTYTVEVEDGLDAASYTGDDSFATAVEGTLSDPRSWTGSGEVSLRRVGAGEEPDFKVSLTSPDTTHRPDMCGFSIPYESSCYKRNPDKRVVINLARWVRGAKAFSSDMTSYRQYAINHEVGHALGNQHKGCDAPDGLAPVMMQQTFGVSNDYVAQLNQVDEYNKDAVPTDGVICKPNAWPNPSS
ncbi:DUF3152 domain-containing protein [Amycolatopsis antarctica]|uniref:DUF3152 domain-containing protein n=1 Tax=Amycolatopsis antarctica TaxID=1854586 RepID=UPI001F0ADB44|nr:DUF3152 domain-containing protein [Amycolatopsis antarctica]